MVIKYVRILLCIRYLEVVWNAGKNRTGLGRGIKLLVWAAKELDSLHESVPPDT